MRPINSPSPSGAALKVLAVACAASGCAHLAPSAADREFHFRNELAVTQTVEVDAAGGRHAFLASLRRHGDEIEVTLFDPVFAAPMLSAAWRRGKAEETLLAAGARPGDGKRLIELLREVYAMNYPPPASGRTRATSSRVAVELEGFGRAPCDFPDRMVLEARVGPAFEVRVETVSVILNRLGARRREHFEYIKSTLPPLWIQMSQMRNSSYEMSPG